MEWQRLVQDTASLDDISASLKRRDTDSSLQMEADETPMNKADSENTIRAGVQAMSEKIQRTIDELFSAA